MPRKSPLTPLLGLGLPLLLSACATLGPQEPGIVEAVPPAFAPGVPTAQEIVDSVTAQAAAFSSFRLTGGLVFKAPELETTYSLPQCVVHFQAPEKLHVSGRKMGVNALRLAAAGDLFLMELPREKEVFCSEALGAYAPETAVTETAAPQRPGSVGFSQAPQLDGIEMTEKRVRAGGRVRAGRKLAPAEVSPRPFESHTAAGKALLQDLFFDRDWETLPWESFASDEAEGRVTLQAGLEDGMRRVVTLEQLEGAWVVLRSELRDGEDRLLVLVSKSDYQTFDSTMAFPAKLEAELPLEDAFLRFTVESFEANATVDPELFEINALCQRLLDEGYSLIESDTQTPVAP